MSKRKLLLADDSVTIRKVVNLTFADEGFEVIAVGDGNSAMDKLREDSPDLMMADVNMPGLNGYEICEKIKRGDVSNRIPVILLVGSFEPFDEDEAKRVGADDYLTKPFQSISQLVETVTMLLTGENDAEDIVSTQEFPSDQSEASTKIEADDSGELAGFGNDQVDDESIHTGGVEAFSEDRTSDYENIETGEVEEDSGDRSAANELSERGFQIVASEASSEETSEFRVEGEVDQELPEIEPFDAEVEEEDYEVESESDIAAIGDEVSISANDTQFDLDESNPLELVFVEKSVEREVSLIEETTDPGAGDDTESILDGSDSDIRSDESSEATGLEVVSDDSERVLQTVDSEEIREALSPDVIDAIVQKVIDTLSDKVVREVASEVVDRRADSIIKEIIDEKMRN